MGQLFDRLCQIAEQDLLPKPVKERVQSAYLFQFPGQAVDILPTVDFDSRENRKFIAEMFFLPFRVIAIEDPTSVIVFADEDPDAIGTQASRFFLEFRTPEHTVEPDGSITPVPEDMRGCAFAAWGELRDVTIAEEHSEPDQDGASPPPPERRWWKSLLVDLFARMRARRSAKDQMPPEVLEYSLPEAPSEGTRARLILTGNCVPLGAAMFKRRKRKDWSHYCHYSAADAAMIACAAAPNALVAMEEIAMFNLPSRWIVKKRFLRKVGERPPGHIARTDERAVYLLMTLTEFSRLIHHGPAGTIKLTHGRRAHPRFLRSERFVHKQGQWTRVRSTVVGPTKGTDPTNRIEYEVLTDR
ncbi:MAG: hypothetical protein U0136_06330 [Bdellovibrionota bacterium]